MSKRQRRPLLSIVLLALASMAAVPASAQDRAEPGTAETPSADVEVPVTGMQATQPIQQQAAPAPKLSMAEKAAAIAGAVAAGAVAFKGLSSLFKSGKKQAAPVAVPSLPIE